MRLEDRVAVVTGAGTGIGRATALRFAEEGATVIALGHHAENIEEVVAEIGGDSFAVVADVSSGASVTAAFAAIEARHDRLDIVVNNAAVTILGAVHDTPEEDWDRTIDTNLKSVYLVSKAAWPLLLAAGGGVVLNNASVNSFVGWDNDAAYCAAKGGVVMLTKCMALDGAKVGIRSNCVCPAFIETPLVTGFLDSAPDPAEARRAATSMLPLRRMGEPVDIANAFVYLASDEARFLTGTSLVVDGGMTSGFYQSGE
jgi:NAD(P)-dependent dehydrogenase (short-subunit alcohol dehydrogenase family)